MQVKSRSRAKEHEGNAKAIEKENAALKKQDLIAGALTDTVFGVTDALGGMISGTKGAFNNLVSTMLGGIQKIIDGLLAEAIAAALAGEAHKGLIGLITGSIAVAGIMALWQKVPQLAQGGIAYGNSMVNVGEYPNAKSNPEVIAPLNKLKDLLGNGTGGGEVLIKFQHGSLEGYMNYNNRKNNSFA